MTGKVRAIGDLVGEVIAAFGHGDFQARQEREQIWRQIVDPRLVSSTMLGPLRRGVLEVAAQDAVTLQELSFCKAHLLNQMQNRLPDHKIRGLRFRIGP